MANRRKGSKSSEPGTVEAPALVVAVTYILCWGISAWLLIRVVPEAGLSNPIPAAVGIFLLLAPLRGADPRELIQALLGRGEEK